MGLLLAVLSALGVASMTTVYVVDDDESVRRALGRLLKSAGIQALIFASAEEFLQSEFHTEDACLVTDIRMPGLSGLELQQELLKRHIDIPVVFVTAFDSDDARTQARLAGAAGYFRKPVDDHALLDAIAWAAGGKGL